MSTLKLQFQSVPFCIIEHKKAPHFCEASYLDGCVFIYLMFLCIQVFPDFHTDGKLHSLQSQQLALAKIIYLLLELLDV